MSDFERLTGLIAAVFTPMSDDGEIDLGRIEPLAAALAKGPLTGVLACGTTGECLSLTVDERMKVTERWVAAAGERLVVLAHVGHNSLPAARALAAHAGKIGARGIAAFAPSYFRPENVHELTAFCGEIASAAPNLPFYYYHIPSMTGVHLPVYDFFRAASGRIGNLAGAKYTHEDLMDFGRCLRLDGGRFDMLFGRDEFLLSALALGARGAVGTTYGFAAPVYADILNAFDSGDLDAAAEKQALAMELVTLFRQFGGLPAAKAIMKMIDLDCGRARLPLRDLPEQELRRFRARLEEIGFFDYCVRP